MVINVTKADLEDTKIRHESEIFLISFILGMVIVIPWLVVLVQWIDYWFQDVSINWVWYFDWVTSFSPKGK